MFDAISVPSPKRSIRETRGWQGYFPYYAGFPESFVASILKTLNLPLGSNILDPWNGSGTTTYAAALSGYRAVGMDINPAMVIVAKARLLSPSEADSIAPLGREIVREAKSIACDARPDEPLSIWFTAATAGAIRAIERCIRRHLVGSATITPTGVELAHISSLAAANYVALFSLCRDLSAKFQTTNPTWLKHPKKGERKIRRLSLTIDRIFQEKLAGMAKALSETSRSGAHESINSEVWLGDTTHWNFAEASFDLILTSPPYCTRIDYTGATRMELATLAPLLSETTKDLSRRMLGSVRVPVIRPAALTQWGYTCNHFLENVRSHPSKASSGYYYFTHLDYFNKIYKSIENLSGALRSDGRAVLVVQDSAYKNIHNDVPTIICEMAAMNRLQLKFKRSFPLRRSMAGINPHARAYGPKPGAVESVLSFVKT